MKKANRLIGITILFIICIQAFSQSQSNRDLSVNDIVPDIEIKNIINYKSGTVKISDFKGKLLILDFWATWCGPCVGSFKKLDSLQKKFKGKIEILPVSYESKAHVESFLKKMKKVNGLLPTSVTEDIQLSKLFKHTSVPHYVWIDGNRKVIAISQGEDVTEKNINKILSGEKLVYAVKNDAVRQLMRIPAFVPTVQVQIGDSIELEKLRDDELIVQTTLTHFIEGFNSGGTFPDSTSFSIRNVTIQRLYSMAIFGADMGKVTNVSSIQVEIPDSALYTHVKGVYPSGKKISSGLETLAWLKVYGYCYEGRAPAKLYKDRYTIMLQDLNRYFGAALGIVGGLEKRNSRYLALVRIVKDDLLHSKGGEPMQGSDKFFSLKIRNQPVSELIYRLLYPLQAMPELIDETGYTEPIDIELNCKLSDLKELNKALATYGLQLIEKEKEMDVLVIKMKQGI